MKRPKEEPAVPESGEARPSSGADAADAGAPAGAGAAEPGAGEPGSGEETAGTGTAAGGAGDAPGDSADVLRDRWLRAEADLQNFRRRARRDVEEATRFAEERMLLEVIELLDDLERAVDAADTDAPDAWLSGVRLVVGRMHDVLARHGVGVLDPAGAVFDPEQHEAMLEIDAGGNVPPGHVAQVVRKGYRRHGRVLRAARVVVARAADGAPD